MAKLNFTNLGFTPSTSPDVVEHRLRIFPAGATPTNNEVYAASYANVGIDGVIDQAEIQGVLNSQDGVFDLYLTSVDDGGNESDYAVKSAVPLDFDAPLPPIWL